MSLVHDHKDTVPVPMLAMAGALVAVSLLLTASVSLGLAPREAVPAVERSNANVAPLETRSLTFSDRADGSVLVADGVTGRTVATIAGDEEGGGFVRGVMRGLARERRMNGVGSGPPFELTLWQNGSLSLTDPTTGRVIELGSFGPANRTTFVRFLPNGDAA